MGHWGRPQEDSSLDRIRRYWRCCKVGGESEGDGGENCKRKTAHNALKPKRGDNSEGTDRSLPITRWVLTSDFLCAGSR